MTKVAFVIGRTGEGLFRWLEEHNLTVPKTEVVAEIIADMIKAYEKGDRAKLCELIERIWEVTNCPPQLYIGVVKQFGKVADTYRTLFSLIERMSKEAKE